MLLISIVNKRSCQGTLLAAKAKIAQKGMEDSPYDFLLSQGVK